MSDRAKRIWTKIVVLFDAIERVKTRYPEPRTRKQQDIITVMERQIINETRKLKELGD